MELYKLWELTSGELRQEYQHRIGNDPDETGITEVDMIMEMIEQEEERAEDREVWRYEPLETSPYRKNVFFCISSKGTLHKNQGRTLVYYNKQHVEGVVDLLNKGEE